MTLFDGQLLNEDEVRSRVLCICGHPFSGHDNNPESWSYRGCITPPERMSPSCECEEFMEARA